MSSSRFEGLLPWSLSVLEDALLAKGALPLLKIPTWLVNGPRLPVAPWSSSAGSNPAMLASLWPWAFTLLLLSGRAPALRITIQVCGAVGDLVSLTLAIVTDHRAFLPFASALLSFLGIVQVLFGLNIDQCCLYLLICAQIWHLFSLLVHTYFPPVSLELIEL